MTLLHCEGSDVGLRLVEDCVCPGYNVTYECTTRGPGSTIFILGTADFEECEINLRHSQFATGAAFGRCMDGEVSGRGISFDGSTYTSQLVVSVSSTLIGKIVHCDYFDGISQMESGSLALNLTSNIGEYTV